MREVIGRGPAPGRADDGVVSQVGAASGGDLQGGGHPGEVETALADRQVVMQGSCEPVGPCHRAGCIGIRSSAIASRADEPEQEFGYSLRVTKPDGVPCGYHLELRLGG